MEDKHIYDRIAQLTKEHPSLDTVSTEVLRIDQDGIMQSSPTHQLYSQTDFVPDLTECPQPSTSQQTSALSIESTPLNDLLQLVIPGQVSDRELIIRKLTDSIITQEYQLIAESIRDLIYASRGFGSERGRGRDRSTQRTLAKPPYNDVKAKLSGLVTRNRQPMFSEKWITMIYERCEATTLTKLIAVENLGNLALTLKGCHPNRFNERVLYHLNLLGA